MLLPEAGSGSQLPHPFHSEGQCPCPRRHQQRRFLMDHHKWPRLRSPPRHHVVDGIMRKVFAQVLEHFVNFIMFRVCVDETPHVIFAPSYTSCSKLFCHFRNLCVDFASHVGKTACGLSIPKCSCFTHNLVVFTAVKINALAKLFIVPKCCVCSSTSDRTWYIKSMHSSFDSLGTVCP